MSKSRFILDTWAILAFLQSEEPAVARVRELLTDAEAGVADASMSLISLGEAFYIVARRRGRKQARATVAAIRSLPIGLLDVPEERVLAAAEVKSRYAISYADAFAVAAAAELAGTLVTGDPEIVRWCQGIVGIEPLRRAGR